MPLSRSQKVGMVTVGSSFAPKIRKVPFWTTAGVRMIPYVDVEKKRAVPATYLLSTTRWNIEISSYESKTFWSLEEYLVRSREGMERLVNLKCIAYSAVTLLPYSDESFSSYPFASTQETRYSIGQQIQASIIFSSFVESLETVKKAQPFIKIIEDYVLSGFKKIQKL